MDQDTPINYPPPGHQLPTTDQNILPTGQQIPSNPNLPPRSPVHQMPTNQNIRPPSPGRQMPTNQNFPPPSPGQQIPTAYQNYPSPSQQMPTNQNYPPSTPPKSPQHCVVQPQYAQPAQQVQWQQYPQPNPQPHYAQPVPQMPYQQQLPPQPVQYPGYPQNTGPQYTPVVAAPPYMNTPLQKWSTELFDCMEDPENCLITALFPCITFGQIAEITDRGMTSCTTSAMIYVLILYFTGGLQWIYSCTYRQKLRAQYNLSEDPLPDCIVHCIFEPCALCQEYRELKNRGFNMQLGWAQNMQMQAQMPAAPGVPPPVQTMRK